MTKKKKKKKNNTVWWFVMNEKIHEEKQCVRWI
jgi:hypothetical protein